MVARGGYGSMGWGAGYFGDADPSIAPSFFVTSVQPIAENVVRVTFNVAPYYSGLLDDEDASLAEKYTLTPVPGSMGADGRPTRTVNIVVVTPSPGVSVSLDLTCDRPMSPSPGAQYLFACSDVWDVTQTFLIDSASATNVPFAGMFKQLSMGVATGNQSRDIANPQTHSALLDPFPNTTNPLNLATYTAGDDGDYVFDTGLTSIKKRIWRRVFTRKGGFLHLPNYGAGLADYGKKLGSPSVRSQASADIEAQVAQEPEVLSVSASIVATTSPFIFRVNLRVQLRSGQAFTISAGVLVSG